MFIYIKWKFDLELEDKFQIIRLDTNPEPEIKYQKKIGNYRVFHDFMEPDRMNDNTIYDLKINVGKNKAENNIIYGLVIDNFHRRIILDDEPTKTTSIPSKQFHLFTTKAARTICISKKIFSSLGVHNVEQIEQLTKTVNTTGQIIFNDKYGYEVKIKNTQYELNN